MESMPEGGQAFTYRVKDKRDGSTGWILKKLKNRKRLRRFEREIRALNTLHSPFTAPIKDFSIEEPAYVVMPDLGVDLVRYASQTRLSYKQSLAIFKQVVAAVEHAHDARVVHRDIKPDNIVVSSDGSKAYLIDFGICQYSVGELLRLTSVEPFGNPAFAAPECFLGREEEPGSACDIYSLGKLFYWMVSGGHHINREYLTPSALERVGPSDPLIRFYLQRLVRGTVKEDHAQRWDANQLLNEINNTIELTGRVRRFWQRGFVLVEDNFGVNETFSASSSRSATTAARGNPPGDQDIGTAFTTPLEDDVKLRTITVALSKRAGDGDADLCLVPDRAGKPQADAVLERFRLNAPAKATPVSVDSTQETILTKGTRYWLLLSTPGKCSEVAIWGAPEDFKPRPALIAKRRDSGDWSVAESKGGPGYAFRVVGTQLTN